MKQAIRVAFQNNIRYLLTLCVLLFSASHAQVNEPKHGMILLNPIEFDREGVDLVGEEGFIFVPENRAVEKCRMISVHFYHFPAKEESGLAPVFILPGGPGGSFTYRSFYKHFSGIRAELWVKELKALNQKRAVVIVNQRGNMRPPGLNTGDWRWGVEKAPVDKLETSTQALARYAEGVKKGVEQWTKNGVDLAGYDIMNISEDLEDLRKSLGYNKIALRGNSFGSQWSLAYMKRWPQNVDRAMLAGVEPLDFAWDSAAWLWKAMERLEKRAAATRRSNIPDGGFLKTFKSVVKKLEGE
ncbi:MAG: alpha/beta fold hydrolase, partial [Calditrichota bacterium]